MTSVVSRNRSNNLNLVLSSYTQKPSIVIQTFDRISDDSYSLVFSSAFDNGFEFEDYDKALSSLTDSNFSIQKESLLKVEDGKSKIFHCVARGNTDSKPYNEENAKGLKAIKANVFVDEDDRTIWKLEGTGDNKRLVRQSPQDFSSILETKRSRDPILSCENAVSYEVGDYAYFFNHEINAMDFGYIVDRDNKEYVFTRSQEKLVAIKSPMQVITSHVPVEKDKNPLNKRHEMTIASEYSMDGYLEYLKKLYGADSEYYKAVERNIREYMMR